MPINFYPYEEDLKKDVNMPMEERIEILLEAAERFKAIVTDPSNVLVSENKQGTVPSDLKYAYNWDGLSQALREVRQLPEGNPNDKRIKSDRLLKLAEVYEVLRAAKMQKLEAVRLALVNEANQLRGST
jgi:biopolymer transport protein ExbD